MSAPNRAPILNRRLSRRSLLGVGAAAAGLGLAGCGILNRGGSGENSVNALVIGSGFGGAVTALRLGQLGVETVVLERGRRWEIRPDGNTFATYRKVDGRAWWMRDKTLFEQTPIDKTTGVFDLVEAEGIGVLRGAGVGGGSLVYNAIMYQPRAELFRRLMPEVDYDQLERTYYPRAREILKPAPVPPDVLASKYYGTTRDLMAQGEAAGLPSRLLDLAVDWQIVRDEIAGKKPASLILGDVWYGANSGGKSSLDQNYLKMAEATGKVQIRPLQQVTGLIPAGNGFAVTVEELDISGAVKAQQTLIARHVFLAAGSLGTTELLFRARARGDLPALSDQVGQGWAGNGDTLALRPSSAPATTPVEGGPAGAVVEVPDGPAGPVALQNLPLWIGPPGTIFTLNIGLSTATGRFRYEPETDTVKLSWPVDSPEAKRAVESAKAAHALLNSKLPGGAAPVEPQDTMTPHPLGGAVLGRVTDAYGRVNGYKNLYVVDGALLPGYAGCVNPSLTIAAIAERNMDRIIPEVKGG